MAKRKSRNGTKRTKIFSSTLDVVIPVYGRADLLRLCVDALSGVDHNLIIVDDAGPEREELDALYAKLPNATVVRHKRNEGFPKSVNDGVKAGKAPHVLILNSDVVLRPDAVDMMMETLIGGDKVGVVAPKLLFPEGTKNGPVGKVQHAGLCVGLKARVRHANIGWSADNPKVNERRSMQMVSAACMLVRRAAWEAVEKRYQQETPQGYGAFSLDYGRGTFEDAEFCLLARDCGYDVVYEPAAVGEHHVGASAELNGGYPVNDNFVLFIRRCGGVLYWDDWRWY